VPNTCRNPLKHWLLCRLGPVRERSVKPSLGDSGAYAQNSPFCAHQVTNAGCVVDAPIGGYFACPDSAVQRGP
jgi:hypothetical protein